MAARSEDEDEDEGNIDDDDFDFFDSFLDGMESEIILGY